MRYGFLSSLGSLLAGAGLAFGQASLATAPTVRNSPALVQTVQAGAPAPGGDGSLAPRLAPETTLLTAEPVLGGAYAEPAGDSPVVWFNAEALLWWLEKGPLPTPLVTIGSITPFGGALGQPNTAILFGGSDLQYKGFGGLRVTSGFWLDDEQVLGFEAGVFVLERRSLVFDTESDAAGEPLFGQPFVNAITGNENAFFISFPGLIAGNIAITTSSRMWGAEANAVTKFSEPNNGGLSFKFLGGFRSLSLNEDLRMSSTIAPLGAGNLAVFFDGQPVNPPDSVAIFDGFDCNNNFYGMQVGTEASWTNGLFTVDLLAKFAAGYSQHLLTIEGNTTLLNAGVPGASLPGGIYAQTTNIGRYYRDNMAIVPELGAKLGVELLDGLNVNFGWTLIYWSSVIRPGQLVDRQISPNRVPSDQTFNNQGSAPRPGFPGFEFSDMWIQGLSLGVSYSY